MKMNRASMNADQSAVQTDGKPTVLIVDDSKVIRLALNKILKPDFVVIQANDGEDALHQLETYPAISAIFSDVSMPVLDGFGLLEKVRSSSEERIAQLPFIIITANDDAPDFIQRVKDAGGDDLVTKPFKTDEIKACIEQHGLLDHVATSQPALESVQPETVENVLDSATEAAVVSEHDAAALLGLDLEQDEPVSVVADEPVAAESESGGFEFIVSEDFFNEEMPVADENKAAVVDTGLDEASVPDMSDFLGDLDEEMLLPDLDIGEPVPEQGIAEVEASAETISDTAAVAEFNADSFEEELSLEIDFDADMSEVMAEAPAHNTEAQAPSADQVAATTTSDSVSEATDPFDSLTLEDIESPAEKARRAVERERIRAELSRLREKEVHDQSYQKDLDNSSTGRIASLYRRIRYKLGRLFRFRK